MAHVVFALVLLMFVGFLFLELARYQRSESRGSNAYPGYRLLLRMVNGLVLLFLLGVLLYAPTPYGYDPVTRYALPGAFVLLIVLLVADIISVRRQFGREARSREQQFLRELEQTVRKKRRR
jgi:uncharacterized BrkB/YihY/UPF0761 family membrane protein